MIAIVVDKHNQGDTMQNYLITICSICSMALTFPAVAFEYDCSDKSGDCDDPGTDVCVYEDNQLYDDVIFCEGSDYADTIYAASLLDDAVVWGVIGTQGGGGTAFCCDSSDFGDTYPILVHAEDGDDEVQLYWTWTFGSFNYYAPWREDSYVKGQNGDDTLRSSRYAGFIDHLWGSYGDDILVGHYGKDEIWGDWGDDTITGGPSNDTSMNKLYGGANTDTITGTQANDTLCGCDCTGVSNNQCFAANCDNGDGADTIVGGGGNDVVDGGPLGDTITTGSGNDTIYGDYNLENTCYSLAGGDTIDAGDGTNYIYPGYSSFDEVTGGDNSDYVFVIGDFADISTGDGVDTIDLTDAKGGYIEVDAGRHSDTILGSPYADTIDGGDHTDYILGGAGADSLTGGDGDDCISGGTQTDWTNSYGNDDYDTFFDVECAFGGCTGGHTFEEIISRGADPCEN